DIASSPNSSGARRQWARRRSSAAAQAARAPASWALPAPKLARSALTSCSISSAVTVDCRPAAARVAPRILRGSNNERKEEGKGPAGAGTGPDTAPLEKGSGPRHAAPVRFDDSDQA